MVNRARSTIRGRCCPCPRDDELEGIVVANVIDAPSFGVGGLEQQFHTSGPIHSARPAFGHEPVRVQSDDVQRFGARLKQTPRALKVSALVVLGVLTLVHFYVNEPVLK